jgi:hypothetical protein
VTGDEIEVVIAQEFQGLGCVVSLLDIGIPVHLVAFGVGHGMVLVVEPVMVDVVAKCSDQQGNSIQVIELGVLSQVLGLEDVMDVLGNV